MSLKAGAERSAARFPFWVGFERQKQQVGKWETCFRFSTFPRGAGAVGMWESQQRFPRAVGNEGNPGFGFPRFPPPVISIALRFLSAPLVVQTEEQFVFGCLHLECGLSVGFRAGGLSELIHC